MDEVEWVEAFEKKLAAAPKSCVRELETKRMRSLGFVVAVEGCLIWVSIMIGKRGGLKEIVAVIDTTQPIVLDRLIWRTISSDGYILDLRQLRHAIRHEKNAQQFCHDALQVRLDRLLANAESEVRWLRSSAVMDSVSIPTVSGGLPSLGKNSR